MIRHQPCWRKSSSTKFPSDFVVTVLQSESRGSNKKSRALFCGQGQVFFGKYNICWHGVQAVDNLRSLICTYLVSVTLFRSGFGCLVLCIANLVRLLPTCWRKWQNTRPLNLMWLILSYLLERAISGIYESSSSSRDDVWAEFETCLRFQFQF